MSTYLDAADAVAILKQYAIDVAEGHLRKGTSILIAGAATPAAEAVITVTVGEHSAHRIVPVTDFLAEGLVGELAEPLLKPGSQLARAIAHLVVKLSRMYVESHLGSFSLTALLEGDHYEIVPKTVALEGTHATTIPHRLAPHAHDAGALSGGTDGFVRKGR